jgi:hypothetical protein
LALRFIAATVIRLLILDACSKAGVLTDEMAMSLIDHLCRVNECERRDAFNTFREANELWEKRSKKKWKLVVAPALLKKYPELKELPAYKPAVIEY